MLAERERKRKGKKGKVKEKEQNKTKTRGGRAEGPGAPFLWLPGGDHTVLALPQRSPCVPPYPRCPEGDPGSVPSPLPLSRLPKPLTCVDKEQDQLRKQDPWTPGQPPRVHPSRWPEVARQDRRTDRLERGLGTKGEPQTRRGWRAVRGRGQHSRDGDRGGAIALGAFEGSPGRPARGCAGTEVSLSLTAAFRRKTKQPAPESWATRAHISSPRVAPTWGWGRGWPRLLPTLRFFLL